MQDATFEVKGDVIPSELDKALRAEFGDKISGISTGPSGVTVHFFDDDTLPSVQYQAQKIVEQHVAGVQSGDITAPEPPPDPLTVLQAKVDALTALLNDKGVVSTAEIETAVSAGKIAIKG